MRCDNCQGSGKISTGNPATGYGHTWICPDCHGSGVTYCCDEAGANPPNVGSVQPNVGSVEQFDDYDGPHEYPEVGTDQLLDGEAP